MGSLYVATGNSGPAVARSARPVRTPLEYAIHAVHNNNNDLEITTYLCFIYLYTMNNVYILEILLCWYGSNTPYFSASYLNWFGVGIQTILDR